MSNFTHTVSTVHKYGLVIEKHTHFIGEPLRSHASSWKITMIQVA